MLENKRIVITGAAGTLGLATAQKASQYGATVLGLDIVDTTSLKGVDEYRKVNLLSTEDTQACFNSLGPIDAICNLAGGFAMGLSASDPSDEQWDQMFRINVTTLRNAVRAAAPLLIENKGGAIVNVGALGALSGLSAMSAYCCAKSSVMRLTESLSEELKDHGINVNAVLPSIIDTPPNRSDMPNDDFSRWVAPEKLAELVCFLASDRASAIHGALIPITNLV
ncbi:MAG: SDR family NAD(P)-dependent oxidoreductase [Pseudomonadales bacterium]|nr:SDR family NAD(P)-dependent oxidoreductase [Pseudomonadales bacterium]